MPHVAFLRGIDRNGRPAARDAADLPLGETARLRSAGDNATPSGSGMMAEVFARLLQPQPPSAPQIAAEVSRVLRRNEEARIYHWYRRTKKFPPRRGEPDG